MNRIFYILFFLTGTFGVYSQEPVMEENEVDKVIDALFSNEEQLVGELMNSLSKYQMLYISLDYNSDSYFAGRDIGINQYNLVPQISYLHSSGLFASISGNYYSKFNPKLDVINATVGYGKNFGKHKKFRYSVYYAKYFYSDNDDNFLDNAFSASFGIKNKNKNIGTHLLISYLFGSEDAIQLTSSSFSRIKILKTNNVTIDLRPQLSITAGKQTIELSRISNIDDSLLFYSEDVFELINTQLSIPIQLNLNSFDFEIGYNFNFANAIRGEDDLKNTNYFNASIAYLINL